MRPILIAAAFASLAAVAVASASSEQGSAERFANAPVTWTIEASEQQRAKGVVQLSLSRRAGGSHWQHSNTRPLAELGGLGASQLASASGGPVRFRLSRDAGTIDCEGVARRFHGTGDCRFVANAAFAEDLARRGYGRATDAELFSLALSNVGRDVIDEFARQGYAKEGVAHRRARPPARPWGQRHLPRRAS
jgi:hypothetical protein